MSTEMIVDAALRQFKAADETLIAWKPEHSDLATAASYAENALIMFQDRLAIMRRALDQIRRLAQSGQVDSLRLWHQASRLFATALRPVFAHRELLSSLHGAGQSVEGGEEFEQLVRQFEETRDHFRRTFPLVTPEEDQAIRDAIARGESQDVEEAFAEIAGMDIPSWRKRMEDHQGST